MWKCSLIHYLMNSHKSRDELHHHDLHLKPLVWALQLLQELLCEIWRAQIIITNLHAFIERDSQFMEQFLWVWTCNRLVTRLLSTTLHHYMYVALYTAWKDDLTLWIVDQVDGGEIKNLYFFLLFMFLRKQNENDKLSSEIN